MKIAIVGTGISGMVAAHHLHREHEITVYEAAARIGGHTHTVPVDGPGRRAGRSTPASSSSTTATTPTSKRCWANSASPRKPSHMSFSVSRRPRRLRVLRHAVGPLRPPRPPRLPHLPPHAARMAPLQPAGAGADRDERDGALARRLARARRLLPPLHRAPDRPPGLRRLVRRPGPDVELPGQLHGRVLRQPRHVQPPQPAALADRRSAARSTYAEAITAPWRDRVRTAAPVRRIERLPDEVRIEADGCETESFDRVVIAAHSDQALAMLGDPSERRARGPRRDPLPAATRPSSTPTPR